MCLCFSSRVSEKDTLFEMEGELRPSAPLGLLRGASGKDGSGNGTSAPAQSFLTALIC